jgi:hypothetical protein
MVSGGSCLSVRRYLRDHKRTSRLLWPNTADTVAADGNSGDGSGTISKQEFAVALKQHCSLEFEPHILEGVLKAGSGDEMDFNTFSAVVMGRCAPPASRRTA